MAKSIGTRIIALTYEGLTKELKAKIQKVALLTRIWNQSMILDRLLAIGQKSFHVISTADILYNQKVEEILLQKGIGFLTIPNADHGLDIEGEPIVKIRPVTLKLITARGPPLKTRKDFAHSIISFFDF